MSDTTAIKGCEVPTSSDAAAQPGDVYGSNDDDTRDTAPRSTAADGGLDQAIADAAILSEEGEFVAIDGPFVVLRVVDSGELTQTSYRIDVLELETGVLHPAGPPSQYFGQLDANPERDVIFFDHGLQQQAAGPTVMYLRNSGFIPPTPPPNYTESMLGNWVYLSWAWSNDGQLGVVGRQMWEGQSYLDFVDTDTGGLLDSIPVETVAHLWGFGAHTFFYADDLGDSFTIHAAALYEGSVWHVTLPSDRRAIVGHDGVAYYSYTDTLNVPLLVRHAPGAQAEVLEIPSGLVIEDVGAAPRNGEWLLVTAATAEGPSPFKLPLKGGEPSALGQFQGTIAPFPVETLNGEWLLLELTEGEHESLVAVRSSDMHPELVASESAIGVEHGSTGQHFYFHDEGEPLRYVGFGDEGPIWVEIADTEEAGYATCTSYSYSTPPPNRSVVRVNGGGGYTLVDLSQPEARIVGNIETSSSESQLECPTWSIDGNSFVYTEQTGTETRLFRVVWNTETPTIPELVYTTSDVVFAAGLR